MAQELEIVDRWGRSPGIDCNEVRPKNSEHRSTKLNRDRKKLQLGRIANCSNVDTFS